MENLNVLTIDDKKYVMADQFSLNNVDYVFLSNLDNPKDFCFRKLKIDGDAKLLVGLDNDEEFDAVIEEFMKNHKDIIYE